MFEVQTDVVIRACVAMMLLVMLSQALGAWEDFAWALWAYMHVYDLAELHVSQMDVVGVLLLDMRDEVALVL